MRARYDAVPELGESEWTGGPVQTLAGDLLGPGPGRCLDLGCGPGHRGADLAELGWQVVGVDLSRVQLSTARRFGRLTAVARADAARLPVRSGSLEAVVSLLTHTDLDDWPGAVREVARILRPGGRFVYAGVHPCFVGPFAAANPDGSRTLHEGYCDTALTFSGPGIGDGLRSRVGVRHLPLSDLLNPVMEAGLVIERLAESAESPLPTTLAFGAVAET